MSAYLNWVKKDRASPLGLWNRMSRVAGDFNHVLKGNPSTHGCQHIVEIVGLRAYHHGMATNVESMVDALVESGRHELADGVPAGREGSLALLRFADLLRRSADRLCHESATCGPKPRRELAGDWGGGGRNYATGCGTSVQPCSEGASIEDVKKGMGRQRTQSRGPATRSRSSHGYEVTSGFDASARWRVN